MATVSNAIDNLKLNNTPFWWLFSGSSKVGQYLENDNLGDSIAHLERVVELLPDGSYKLKSSDKEANHAGAVHFTFSKSNKAGQPANTMQSAQSTNAYGISDTVLKQIQEEARRTLLFEQMSNQFGPLVDLVKDIDSRLKKVEKYLADEDEDGTPDFLDSLKKVSEVTKHGSDIKKVFEGGKLFG